jgi:sulfotransferase family protein
LANFDRMPNLFIIGAAKAGTTALYNYLTQHPQVFLCRVKETMFFNREEYYARGLDWYEDVYFQGAEGYPVRAEATPHYLYWSEKVAPRIKEVYGGRPVKFIVSFRDPVSRAYSWYWNMVREGREDLDFDEALRVEESRLEQYRYELYQLGSMVYGYSAGSRYASLLQPYLELFSLENFFFVFQDDLKSRANETCKEIFEFLGIESSIQINTSNSNPASMPRSRLLHKTLRQRSLFKEFIKPFIPKRVRRPLKKRMMQVNLKETPYVPLDPQLAHELRLSYRTELEKLEKITGRELSSWKAE